MTLHRKLLMLARYTEWANQRLYNALTSLTPDILEEARPNRPSGLLGVLGHIYVVDLIWKANLEGIAHGFESRQLDTVLPLADLREKQAALDQWYIAYTASLTDTQLEDPVAFSFVGGREAVQSRCDILLHVANHKTYHRGYVADMLGASGARPPSIDLCVYVRDIPGH